MDAVLPLFVWMQSSLITFCLVVQIYPENALQAEMMVSAAMKVGNVGRCTATWADVLHQIMSASPSPIDCTRSCQHHPTLNSFDCAPQVGFSGGLVVDFPHSTRAKKYFLVLMVGTSTHVPQVQSGVAGGSRPMVRWRGRGDTCWLCTLTSLK